MEPLKKANYVLESPNEIERLQYQSQISAYDFKEELKGLKVVPGVKILDAGCGAGNVAEYLSSLAENVVVSGWDVSMDRIAALKQKYKNQPNLRFEVRDLMLPTDSMLFDVIVCRYVFQHFPKGETLGLLKNLMRVLKPNGTLCVIDMEGLFSEIYPASPFLKKCLKKVRSSRKVDLQVGRKIPHLFFECGLNEIEWNVTSHLFKNHDLKMELKNIEKRFENAFNFFKECIGDAQEVKEFEKEYLAAISDPGSVLLYNKFVVTGKKTEPKSVLSLKRGKKI